MDDPEGDEECVLDAFQLRGIKGADEVRETRLRQAHQLVAMDGALVPEAFVRTHLHLCREAMASGVDRSADDGREPGIDHCLTADDQEDAESLRVATTRPLDTVEIASPHGSAW